MYKAIKANQARVLAKMVSGVIIFLFVYKTHSKQVHIRKSSFSQVRFFVSYFIQISVKLSLCWTYFLLCISVPHAGN